MLRFSALFMSEECPMEFKVFVHIITHRLPNQTLNIVHGALYLAVGLQK